MLLAIETSCDETAVALYSLADGLIEHQLHSQVQLHANFGGVVPELASRDHLSKIIPLIQGLMRNNQIKPSDLTAICYTKGPGLIGALLVGTSVAKSLAYAYKIPAIGINHLEGHLLAPLLDTKDLEFPFVSLLVSGGHTLLVNVKAVGDYEILGGSLDDAAGEAFDKTAKIMGLEYPGGPRLAKLAESGKPGYFEFPRPLTQKPGLDFSFAGLKTAALNAYSQSDKSPSTCANIAYSFEEAVVDTLIIKAKRALKACNATRLVVAGGVSANKKLRYKLDEYAKANAVEVYYPKLEFCTDNAAMIAIAGALRIKANKIDSDDPLALNAYPRLSLTD